MKFRIITLNQFLNTPIYKSINITRKNGDKLILVKDQYGLALVDSENEVNLTPYRKRLSERQRSYLESVVKNAWQFCGSIMRNIEDACRDDLGISYRDFEQEINNICTDTLSKLNRI